MKMITSQIIELQNADLSLKAEEYRVPIELVEEVAKNQKLTVPNFAAGGIATPADASLMMQLGAETVFVGSGIFKSEDPSERAHAIVKSVTHYRNAKDVLRASYDLKDAMKGILMSDIPEEEKFSNRGD